MAINGVLAAREVAPIVLIVAVDSMMEGGFCVVKIQGLNHYMILGKYGYLVQVNNRAGDSSMFAWYVKTMVVPTIQGVREAQECFIVQTLH
jgi:hypothetical protein